MILSRYFILSAECFVLVPTTRVSKRNLPIGILQRSSSNNRLNLLSMSSDFIDDAPLPHTNMTAEGVVTTCMDALLNNDSPRENAGLSVCFDFSSDRCRASLGGNLDDFISYANNPTFGSMINANEYVVVSVGPVIAATNTRGAMQTVLIKVKPANGKDRTFLW